MRAFASYWVTVLICVVLALLYWLGEQAMGPISNVIDWVLPGGVPNWWLIPAVATGIYAIVRYVLHRVLAYADSAIEASPRSEGTRGQRRAALGDAAYTAFGNPTGLWLAPFVTLLGVASAFAVFVRWNPVLVFSHKPQGWQLVIILLLTLLSLYVVTLTSAMVRPDPPQPLRSAAPPDLEPILLLRHEDPVP